MFRKTKTTTTSFKAANVILNWRASTMDTRKYLLLPPWEGHRDLSSDPQARKKPYHGTESLLPPPP